jgi:hypothetical protein
VLNPVNAVNKLFTPLLVAVVGVVILSDERAKRYNSLAVGCG